MHLSRYTVQTHVSHILAKLGARSRAEIIREALPRPAPPDLISPSAASGSSLGPKRRHVPGRPSRLQDQLGLERHGGRVPAGLWARSVQRLLALNAAVRHNLATAAPVKRSLIAYDH